ncbi:MAG: O-succinylbenzoate synthase, partial [Tomitella sp.]|nr:O-succinylbenzoate synthase [Tomitella sp.]
EDPFRVVRAGGADLAVVKAAPLGGVRRLVDVAERLGVPIVVSSAIDSVVGIGAGLAAAAALPDLPHACGLGTGGLFVDDVAEPRTPVAVDADGGLGLAADRAVPDPDRLARLAAPAERRRWWLERLERCHRLLTGPAVVD